MEQGGAEQAGKTSTPEHGFSQGREASLSYSEILSQEKKGEKAGAIRLWIQDQAGLYHKTRFQN